MTKKFINIVLIIQKFTGLQDINLYKVWRIVGLNFWWITIHSHETTNKPSDNKSKCGNQVLSIYFNQKGSNITRKYF